MRKEEKEEGEWIGMYIRRGTARAKALRKPRTMTDVYCILDRVLPTGLVNETVFLLLLLLLLLLFVAVMAGLDSAWCKGRERKDSAGRES